MNERTKKLLNIGFENLNWQEADQLAIYKAQLSSRVEDLTLYLPLVIKTEFLLTISIQYQPDK